MAASVTAFRYIEHPTARFTAPQFLRVCRLGYQGAPLATWIAANVTTPGPHLLILTVAGELEYLTVTV